MADKWDQYGTPVAPAAPDKWDKYGTPVAPPVAAAEDTSSEEERGFIPRLKENATNLVINTIRDPLSLVRGAMQFLPSAPMGGTFGPGMAAMGGIPIDPSVPAQSQRWDVSLPSERAADMVIPLGTAALATLAGTPAGRGVARGAAAGTGDIIGNTARFGVGALKGVPEAWTSIRGIHLMKPGTFIDPLIQLGKAGAEEVQGYRATRAADAAFRASQPPAPEWMNNPPKGTPGPPPRPPAEPPPAEPPVSTKRTGGFGSTGVARKPMGPPKVTYNPEELPTIIDPDPLRPVPPTAPPEPSMPTKRTGGFGSTGVGGKKTTGAPKVTYSPEDLPVVQDPETLRPVPSSAPVDEFAGVEREAAVPPEPSPPLTWGSPEWIAQYKLEHPDLPLPAGVKEPAPTLTPPPAPQPLTKGQQLDAITKVLEEKGMGAAAPDVAAKMSPTLTQPPAETAPAPAATEASLAPAAPATGGGITFTIPEEKLKGLLPRYRQMAESFGNPEWAKAAQVKDTKVAQYLLDKGFTPEQWEAMSEADKNLHYKAAQPGVKTVKKMGTSKDSRPLDVHTIDIRNRMRDLAAANPMRTPPQAGPVYPQPVSAPGSYVNGVAPSFPARAPGMPPPPEMTPAPPPEPDAAEIATPRGRRAEVKAPEPDPNVEAYTKIQGELDALDKRAPQMTRKEWEDEVSFESPNQRMRFGSETKKPLTQQEATVLNRVRGNRVEQKNYPVVKAGDMPTKQQVEMLNGSYRGNVMEQRGAWQELRGQEHRHLVQAALNRGETVPAKVLADYPELAAKEMQSQALRQAEESSSEAHPLDKSANEIYGAPYNDLKSQQQMSLKNFKSKTGNPPTIDDVRSGAFKRR